MSAVSFTVDGPPIPKARARSARNGRLHYTPSRTREYEATVGVAFIREAFSAGWSRSKRYAVTVEAFFADKRSRDLDNVAKSILDGLNGHAYKDDSQVDRLYVFRRLDRARPRVEVLVEVLGD